MATHFSTGMDFEDGQNSQQRMNVACWCTVSATDEPGCCSITHAKYPFWDRGCVQGNKCILCYMWVFFLCCVNVEVFWNMFCEITETVTAEQWWDKDPFLGGENYDYNRKDVREQTFNLISIAQLVLIDQAKTIKVIWLANSSKE